MTKIIKVYSKVHGEHDVLVDDEDYERVVPYAWFIQKTNRPYRAPFYAVGKLNLNGWQKTIRMHRLILGLKSDDYREVHHKNGNGLDNRKSNIEPVTQSINQLASKRVRNAKRVYELPNGRFLAKLHYQGARIELGRYNTEEEAKAAVEEYLRCNPR